MPWTHPKVGTNTFTQRLLFPLGTKYTIIKGGYFNSFFFSNLSVLWWIQSWSQEHCVKQEYTLYGFQSIHTYIHILVHSEIKLALPVVLLTHFWVRGNPHAHWESTWNSEQEHNNTWCSIKKTAPCKTRHWSNQYWDAQWCIRKSLTSK